MRHRIVPDETVRRLPIYLRGLSHLAEQGVEKVSSHELACLLHVESPQIRKDLSYFGDFGTPGIGYGTEDLLGQIRGILKLDRPAMAALIGLGNLGKAILHYSGFNPYNLHIVAIFDNDHRKVGHMAGDIEVEDISKVHNAKSKDVSLGIITVPTHAAQQAATKLVEAGVRGILNFAPAYLKVPRRVKVISIDIAMDLARLRYYLPRSNKR